MFVIVATLLLFSVSIGSPAAIARANDELPPDNSELIKPRDSDSETWDESRQKFTIEGDIDVYVNPEEFFSSNESRRRVARTAIKHGSRDWRRAIIPYRLHEDLTRHQRNVAVRAMAEIQNHTCVQFTARTDERDYVYLLNKGDTCSSALGRRGGDQAINLGRGCFGKGIIIHELMHAMGFDHEHNRPDRNEFVTVNFTNIQTSKAYNFILKTLQDVYTVTPYDFASIMHYSRNAFSRNGWDTIVTKNYEYIGQRNGLSEGDIKKINYHFDCAPKPTVEPTEEPKCADNSEQCARMQSMCRTSAYVRDLCRATCRSGCPRECHNTRKYCFAIVNHGLCDYRDLNTNGCSESCGCSRKI